MGTNDSKCFRMYRTVSSTYDIHMSLKEENRGFEELLRLYTEFLQKCYQNANEDIICDDLSVDALYHLHLLHPARFRYDCILKYGGPVHHYPSDKGAYIIYRKHIPTGQFELLEYNRETLTVQLKPLHCSISDSQRWKKSNNDRLKPYCKTLSSKQMPVYLSLRATNPLQIRNTETINGNSFSLELAESTSPRFALQGWTFLDAPFQPTICLIDEGLMKWRFCCGEDKSIIWREPTDPVEEQYTWGICLCPIIA